MKTSAAILGVTTLLLGSAAAIPMGTNPTPASTISTGDHPWHFRDTCQDLSISGLDGPAGRQMVLSASCTKNDKTRSNTNLDLNTCLGWDHVRGSILFDPPSSGVTSWANCSNTQTDAPHWGDNFGCTGPCDKHGNVFNVVGLNQFVGNNNGALTCHN